jgi:hypothetical protein
MKQLSKAELLRQLNKVDVLEVITELVQRSQPDPHRQAKISAFIKKAKEQVADDRDVLLISIKIK